MTSTPPSTASRPRRRWGAAGQGLARRTPTRCAAPRCRSPHGWSTPSAPQPGHDVLELAAGPGDVGFLAAELIRPGGTLICSDVAPEMLTAAQERAKELGINNVRFLQVDAEAIDLPAAARRRRAVPLGLHAAGRPRGGAARDAARAAAGRAASRSPRGPAPTENPWRSAAVGALVERGLIERPEPGEPGPFAWARAGTIAETLDATGFDESRSTRSSSRTLPGASTSGSRSAATGR